MDPDWSDHCGDIWRAHVIDQTGRDICAITGPSPRRPRDWVAMMRLLGVRDMAGVVSAVHGPSLPSFRRARRGDIARRGWALGIVRGETVEFYGGTMIPLGQVDQVWPVRAWSPPR